MHPLYRTFHFTFHIIMIIFHTLYIILYYQEQEKLKSKVVSFEVSHKKKLKPRKPICIGIKFTNNVDEVDPILKDFLKISLYKSQGM